MQRNQPQLFLAPGFRAKGLDWTDEWERSKEGGEMFWGWPRV